MDQDLFISILSALSPEAIQEITKMPIEAQCTFTEEPDYDDQDQFVPAYRPFVLQIRGDYLVECQPKSKKVFGGFQLTLDYKFQVKRFPYDVLSQLGEPYALVLYLPEPDENEEQLVIKYGVKIEAAEQLQKFANCLQQKIIFQLDIHSNFKVMQRLFTSSTATMYSTTRDKDQKELVVKCIRKDLFRMTGRDVIKGIERQYAIPHRLKHQNICKYYGVYESQEAVYVVMEKLFVNLLQFLQMRVAKSVGELKLMLWKIFTGVNVLHENFIMHRDLKLENIMVSYEPVLIDFGLAEYEEKEPFMFAKCGTPGYTAPQICSTTLEKPYYNRSCDVFSLGCIFHYVLIGRPLFQALTVQELIQKNKQCIINPEDPKYKILKDSEKDLLFRMLQKNPKERISVKEILAHQFFSSFNSKPEVVQKQENCASEADQNIKVET